VTSPCLLAVGFWWGGVQVGLGVEEGAIHATDPVGGFGGGAAGGGGVGEGVAEGLEFGFEVVEGGEEHRLRRHGKLGAAELELAVMGENHVFDQDAEAGWELLRGVLRGVVRGRRGLGLGGCGGVQEGDFFVEHALADGDVTDELAFEGVVEAGAPGEFADFADVVEDGAGEEEVGVDFRVEGRGRQADADEGEDVLEEATDPGVVEALRGGCFEKGGANLRVVEEGEDEGAEVGILEGGDVAAELGGHGGDVVLSGGDEVGGVDFRVSDGTHLGDGDLELAVVPGDLTLNLDVAAARAMLEDVGEVVPHAGFELAGFVGQGEGQILAAALAVAGAEGGQAEEAGDGLIFEPGGVGDVKVFHS
jgi:hypothetical protein